MTGAVTIRVDGEGTELSATLDGSERRGTSRRCSQSGVDALRKRGPLNVKIELMEEGDATES